jgi:hypothetical protein
MPLRTPNELVAVIMLVFYDLILATYLGTRNIISNS